MPSPSGPPSQLETIFYSISINTPTSYTGGCHYIGTALCFSHMRQTRKYNLPAAWGSLAAYKDP